MENTVPFPIPPNSKIKEVLYFYPDYSNTTVSSYLELKPARVSLEWGHAEAGEL